MRASKAIGFRGIGRGWFETAAGRLGYVWPSCYLIFSFYYILFGAVVIGLGSRRREEAFSFSAAGLSGVGFPF